MKTYFSFSLKGNDWWKPFLLYWILYLAFSSPSSPLGRDVSPPQADVFLNILLFILQVIFTIVFLRIILPKVSFGNESPKFRGDIGTYLKINVIGALLTVVTLTMYAPWYARRVAAYLVGEMEYRGEHPEFLGDPKRLFRYFILGFWLPVLVLSVLFGLIIYAVTGGESMYLFSGNGTLVTLLSVIMAVVMFIALVPFIYLVYSWFIHIRWRDVVVSLQASFHPSWLYILGQLVLTIITAGIYWPAAMLKLLRYFAGRVVLSRNEVVFGRLGFEGDIGRGFGLIWGQTLLCIITLGVYTPWAVEKVGSWITGHVFYEDESAVV